MEVLVSKQVRAGLELMFAPGVVVSDDPLLIHVNVEADSTLHSRTNS